MTRSSLKHVQAVIGTDYLGLNSYICCFLKSASKSLPKVYGWVYVNCEILNYHGNLNQINSWYL